MILLIVSKKKSITNKNKNKNKYDCQMISFCGNLFQYVPLLTPKLLRIISLRVTTPMGLRASSTIQTWCTLFFTVSNITWSNVSSGVQTTGNGLFAWPVNRGKNSITGRDISAMLLLLIPRRSDAEMFVINTPYIFLKNKGKVVCLRFDQQQEQHSLHVLTSWRTHQLRDHLH